VLPETCFSETVILPPTVSSPEDSEPAPQEDDEEDDIPLAVFEISRDIFGNSVMLTLGCCRQGTCGP